jgi:hypothetical protein
MKVRFRQKRTFAQFWPKDVHIGSPLTAQLDQSLSADGRDRAKSLHVSPYAHQYFARKVTPYLAG